MKLKDICEVKNGSAYKPEEWGKEGLKIVRIQNLNGNSEYNYFNGNTEKKVFIDNEDILFSWSGSFGTFKWNGGKALLNQHIFKVISKEGINNDFLYLLLKYHTKDLEKLSHGGGGLVHIKKADFENFEINIPKKQDLIVKKLFLQENKLNKIKTLLEKIEIRNQYYADKLLSGDLSIDEEGKIIKEIKEKSISFIENLITEYQKSKLDAKFGLKDGTYRFFKSSKEIYWSNDFIYDGEAVIMADGGKANVDYYNGKFSTSNHVYVFKSEKVNTKYLYYLLKSNIEKIEDCFQGAALKNLSKKQFKNLEIEIFENIDYQNNIVKFLDKLEDEKSKVERLLELEEKRFEWLSDKLLSGEYIIKEYEEEKNYNAFLYNNNRTIKK